jgi:hypothetical protein
MAQAHAGREAQVRHGLAAGPGPTRVVSGELPWSRRHPCIGVVRFGHPGVTMPGMVGWRSRLGDNGFSWVLAWGSVLLVVVWFPASAVAGATAPIASSRAAVVAGQPLKKARLDHWMWIAGKSQAAASPGAPVIVPTDPPRFAHCIANVRTKIPTLARTPVRELRRDCRQLFTSISAQVMDFLIKARWYEAQADQDHIVITAGQVLAAFRKAKREQFRTRKAWRQFLKQTGQTAHDIIFRFRINLVYDALLKQEHVDPKALEAKVQAAWRPSTVCARYYVMYDCANSTKTGQWTRPGAGSFSGSFF